MSIKPDETQEQNLHEDDEALKLAMQMSNELNDKKDDNSWEDVDSDEREK